MYSKSETPLNFYYNQQSDINLTSDKMNITPPLDNSM